MTGQEAVALLAGRLGRRTGLESLIVTELNVAQDSKLEKAGFYPWFLGKDDQSTMLTSANVEFVNLPTDFLGFDDEVDGLFYKDTSGSIDPWVPVMKDVYSFFKERYRNPQSPATGTGVGPEVFDIFGSPTAARVFLRPIPTSAIQLRILYRQKQALVANDATTNLWLTHAHDWLVGEAGMMMAAFQTQNPDLGGLFSTMATAGRKRVTDETTARREAGRMVAMGED